MMSNNPTPDAGRSLWGDAWRRLKKNRLAMLSLIFIVLLSFFGFTAPFWSAEFTRFSPTEGHTRLARQAPGARDVSTDHPSWDGDKSSFDFLDFDGDGALGCVFIPPVDVPIAGLSELKELSPTLHAETVAALNSLDAQIGIRNIVAIMQGSLSCPELALAEKIAQGHFDFLIDRFDLARGDAEPVDLVISTDDLVTFREFPKDDLDLPKEFRGFGLAGPDAFRALDVDGDHIISAWEIGERTRHLRQSSLPPGGGPKSFDVFIRRHDLNGDLKISRDEYPGAPVLNTFHLGTDNQGRDVLTRLMYGARLSIMIGLLSTLVSLIIGVTWGAVAGYVGGRLDNFMMRIVDVLYGLPFMFLVILIMVIIDDRNNVVLLFVALGAVQWLTMARVVRGQVMSLKNREFVEAARAIGVPKIAIVFRHLIRNAIGPVVVYSTLLVPAVILEEAFLSFLGLGVELSWGSMIADGSSKMELMPWLIIFPGLALAGTLFAMNFLGDGVRDAIDPQMQGK